MKRLSLVVMPALLLALCLLATAGPALAAEPAATMSGTFVGVLDPGEVTVVNGTTYTEGWVPFGLITQATGPQGQRFLGWAVMCLNVIEPPTGNNYHAGDIVFTTVDPSSLPGGWNPALSFEANLPPTSTWLWKGTWDGVTLNKRNHMVHIALEGWNGNAGLTANVTWKMNDWTNVHMVALIEP